MHSPTFIAYTLALAGYASGYFIHELHNPENDKSNISEVPNVTSNCVNAMPTDTQPILREADEQYVIDGDRHVRESCYRVTDEYETTLHFDEVATNGKMIFPVNYANLQWSCRFRIINETEQTQFPPQNHATSHPNLLFADTKTLQDSYCKDDGMDAWIAIDNSDTTKPLRVFDVISLRHQPLYGLHVPVIAAFKQTYITGAPHQNGTRYYSHVYQSTLSYPYQIILNFEYLTKLEFIVIPSGSHHSPDRHPFFLDDMKLRFKELMPISDCRKAHHMHDYAPEKSVDGL